MLKKEDFHGPVSPTWKRGSAVYKDVGIVTVTTVTVANGTPAGATHSIPMFPLTEKLFSERLRGLPEATQPRAGHRRTHRSSGLQRLGWPSVEVTSFFSQLTLNYLSHLQIKGAREAKMERNPGVRSANSHERKQYKNNHCVPGDT